jgi:hypothetical protein
MEPPVEQRADQESSVGCVLKDEHLTAANPAKLLSDGAHFTTFGALCLPKILLLTDSILMVSL